jgi:hypothetical protein
LAVQYGSNSIATIVKLLSGNMMSLLSDFLTTDGEIESRNMAAEFENATAIKEEMLNKWNEGWDVLLNTLTALREDDLLKIIYTQSGAYSSGSNQQAIGTLSLSYRSNSLSRKNACNQLGFSIYSKRKF